MNAVIDIIIVAIFALTIYFGVKRGFVKTVIGACAFLVSVLVALALCSPVATALHDGPVGDFMENTIIEVIEGVDVVEIFSEEDNTDNDEHNYLKTLFGVFGSEKLYEELHGELAQVEDKSEEMITAYMCDKLVPKVKKAFCKVAAFLLLFVVARILLKIAEWLIDKVATLPVLKQANKLLGGVAGFVVAILRANIFCIVLKLLTPILTDFSSKLLPSSTLFHLFEDIIFRI